MKEKAYFEYEKFYNKNFKNRKFFLLKEREFNKFYTIIKYKSLKENFTLNISQLVFILHKKLFLEYFHIDEDDEEEVEEYLSEKITKFIDEVKKDLEEKGWSEDDEDDETAQYKISYMNKNGSPVLFINDDAFDNEQKKDVINAYEYFKSEIEKQISDGDLRSPNIKGFIIDKEKNAGHSRSLISSIVRGAMNIVDKLPDLGEKWCYTKSGRSDEYNFDLNAMSDNYQSFGIVLRLIDDEIQFCSMACIQQNSKENLYISYLCSWKYAYALFDEIKKLFQSKSVTCGKLDQVSLSSVSECDTVNFYANQGMLITEDRLRDIKKDALKYVKKFIEANNRQKIKDFKDAFSGDKPDKPCNIEDIEDVFNACKSGGGKFLFSEGMRDGYTNFDLFYLIKDEILPNLKELLEDYEEDDKEEEEEEEEEEKFDFYHIRDDEKETKKYFKQYDNFFKEHPELGIGSLSYNYFNEVLRIIRTSLEKYDLRTILDLIHTDDIKKSLLPDIKIKISSGVQEDIREQIVHWDNNQINFIESSRKEAEGSGIKGKKFFEQLKKYGIDPDDYLIGVKANAKKNKYDPKLIDWAYNDVHKLKYFSPEGVKRFGRVGYKDNFIYKHLEKKKEVEKGTAKKMRDRFKKSHEAMTKKYDLGVYSPNELSLKILW